MNTADVADCLRYTGKHPRRSVYKFIRRHNLTVRHDGDRVLLARADVDRALTNQRPSHVRQSAATNSSTVMTQKVSQIPNHRFSGEA